LTKSHRPVRSLACPARFECATYALEALKMWLNNSRNNDLSLAKKVFNTHRDHWNHVELTM